tara:strand:- start:14997 stop:15203 length:207 start_codon:yes stop_codon:yes gene_type:complete
MFKHSKQDKKSIKTFKNNPKSICNPCNTEIGNPLPDMSEHIAEYATKKKPKKRMPKNEEVFGTKPSKK